MVKNSEGSSFVLLAYYRQHVSSIQHTKPALRHCTLFAILVVVRAQLVVAEDLVCFSNLSSYEPRYPHNVADAACGPCRRRSTYLLELCVRGLVAGVLVYLLSGVLVAVTMQ
jgi:nucleoside permease NupC